MMASSLFMSVASLRQGNDFRLAAWRAIEAAEHETLVDGDDVVGREPALRAVPEAHAGQHRDDRVSSDAAVDGRKDMTGDAGIEDSAQFVLIGLAQGDRGATRIGRQAAQFEIGDEDFLL